MYDPRNNLSAEVSAQLISHFGDKVFRTVVPRNVRLAEAPSFGRPVHAARPRFARRAGLPGAGRRDAPPRGRAADAIIAAAGPRPRPTHSDRGAMSTHIKKPTLGRGLATCWARRRRGPCRSRRRPARGAGDRRTRRDAGGHQRPADAELTRLPLDLLQRGKYQPRVDMRPESLEELAASIQAQGVVQPIVVRPVGQPEPGQQHATRSSPANAAGAPRSRPGLTHIPAVIRHVPDNAAIAMALIENIQREDLNPLEEARALERLIAEFGLTHQQAADAVGRSRAAVSNLLRLLELAPEVCDRLERRELEMGHARALLGLENKRKQVELATLVVTKSLSVRETEALVRRISNPAPAATPAAAPARGAGPEHPPPAGRPVREARRPRGDRALGRRQGQDGGHLQQPRRIGRNPRVTSSSTSQSLKRRIISPIIARLC